MLFLFLHNGRLVWVVLVRILLVPGTDPAAGGTRGARRLDVFVEHDDRFVVLGLLGSARRSQLRHLDWVRWDRRRYLTHDDKQKPDNERCGKNIFSTYFFIVKSKSNQMSVLFGIFYTTLGVRAK